MSDMAKNCANSITGPPFVVCLRLRKWHTPMIFLPIPCLLVITASAFEPLQTLRQIILAAPAYFAIILHDSRYNKSNTQWFLFKYLLPLCSMKLLNHLTLSRCLESFEKFSICF